MRKNNIFQNLLLLGVASIFMTMCTPPDQSSADEDLAEQARQDSGIIDAYIGLRR